MKGNRRIRKTIYLSAENHAFLKSFEKMTGCSANRFLNALLTALRRLPAEDSWKIARAYFERERECERNAQFSEEQSAKKELAQARASAYKALAEIFEVLYMLYDGNSLAEETVWLKK